ncbi:Carboxylesterase type B [Trinorchestia longiramus]|nr:Carboxylesterase type B [Trinorchestia longiramus]
MGSVSHLHRDTGFLPVAEYLFLLCSLHPHHLNYLTVTQPSGPRSMKRILPSRFLSSIAHLLSPNGDCFPSTYRQSLSSLHCSAGHLCSGPQQGPPTARIGAAQDLTCPACGVEDQTTSHLFSCPNTPTHLTRLDRHPHPPYPSGPSPPSTLPLWTGNTVEGTEDCLTLDVFTPQLGYDSPLPVVVYVGGASMGGDLHRPLLLSAFGSFSSKRRMVVVSPNIRRGALGVMPHPGIAEAVYPPTAGGQAASDLTAALQWVARNIEHFGGDPSSVTLLGHRAGAGLVYPILGSPKTRDLVHRAWLSGAPPLYPVNPWRESGVDFLRPSNCSRLDCLSRLTARQIMDAPVEALRRPDVGRPWLVADGVYISFVPSVPTVPLMIGTPVHSAAPSLLSARRPVSRSSQPSASVPHPLDVVTRVVSQVLSDALVFASNASLLQDDLYFNRWVFLLQQQLGVPSAAETSVKHGSFPPSPRFPPDSPWYRPPPPLPHFPLDEARRLVHLYSDVITDPWLLLVTMVSDAMFVCPTLSLSSHLSQATTLPPHVARSPHHLPQHLHIIASGRHPAALHQSTFSVYSYLSTHRRRSMLGNLADPDSDIDAIFGIFHKTNDKFPGNEFPEDDQTNAEEISDAGLESTDKDASNEFYWSGNTGLNSEAMPYSDVQKFARYSSTKDSPNYSDTQNFPSYSGTQVSPGYREKERLFDDALTDVNIDYNSVDSNHFRRSINHTDDMRLEINDEGSKLQMPVNEGNNYLDDDGKRTLPRHDKGNIRRSSDAITTSRNAPEETAAKGNTVSEKGFKENGVVEDARRDTKRSARHSEDKNSGLSKEDQSYVEKMQELFTLFVELGKPERYFPTPGHVGTYMVGANVTIEKRKQFCIFWEKWKNLAKRY